MADEKIVNPAEPEEEDNIVELTDEDGCVVRFEYITTVDYEGDNYVVLMPLDEEHPEDEQEEAEVIILKIEQDENGEDTYVTVDDEDVNQAVFERFLAMLEEEDE